MRPHGQFPALAKAANGSSLSALFAFLSRALAVPLAMRFGIPGIQTRDPRCDDFAALAIEDEALRALTNRLAAAREEERHRIARDLHDQMGSILVALRMDAHIICNHADTPPALRARLAGMEPLIDEAINATRAIINELRPPILDFGLVPTLEWQVDQFTLRTGIPCSLIGAPEDVPLDADRSLAIFRLVQEALTNVTKHAAASSVEITVTQAPNEVTVAVYDNGLGITAADTRKKGHFGLIGMHERVRFFGGHVRVTPRQGGGTVVWLAMPFTMTDSIAQLGLNRLDVSHAAVNADHRARRAPFVRSG